MKRKQEKAGSLHITPLGGLGEIGLNMMAYEYGGKFLVVDCGLAFPSPETPGVDLVIPDIQYLRERSEHVLAILLTHAHEDHIGALPYVLPRLPVPVYGSPMTLGMLEGKLKEHRLHESTKLHRVTPREPIHIGPFTVRFLQVTHSILDGMALAITTPAGTIVHTGDFKIDHTPVDGKPSDLFSLAQLGEQGVLALLSDSTNVTHAGTTPSEREIRGSFQEIFPKAAGLVVVATFSSNIQRIQQVIEVAAECGRKVILNGRSMLANVQVARSLGYLKIPADTLIEVKDFKRFPRGKLLVLSTGSQGEPNSSLVRIAFGEHREIAIEEGDLVVLSSKSIPGNERAIGTLINLMFRRGARVVHEKVSEVHVSGHASREDLKLMIALTRPRYFIPIHGELRHLVWHRDLAMEMGVPRGSTLVAENGDRIRIDHEGLAIAERVPCGRVFVDGKGVGDVRDIVLRDRRHLSEDGMAVVVLVVEKSTGKVLQGPELLTRGVVHEDESQDLLEDAKETILKALIMGPSALDFREEDEAGIKDIVIRSLRRYFKKHLGRRPVVLPLVMEM